MRNAAFWAKMLPVITAFAAGKPCQVKLTTGNQWKDLDTLEPVAWYEDNEYRIKPASIKYRRYLYKLGGGVCMGSLTDHPDCSKPSQIQQEFYFIKWIDTGWQEYELPVNTEAGG